MLTKLAWKPFLTICSGAILACFALSVTGGVQWAVYALPLSGLFMSVIYPTVNSKGISCVPKSEHGAAAGVILFYTCLSAVLAPLAIGAISDASMSTISLIGETSAYCRVTGSVSSVMVGCRAAAPHAA